MQMPKMIKATKRLLLRLMATAGAIVLTLAMFLVLPLMQAINKPQDTDLAVREVDTAQLEPPPPVVEQQPEPEPEQQEAPPELAEEAHPLTSDQLDHLLNPSFTGGWGSIDSVVKLSAVTSGSGSLDDVMQMAGLDQKPRPIYQPGPVIDTKVRKRAPGTVYVIFIVDPHGRVESATVQKSSDPVFEKPALAAVKQWKFEPGKRNGKPVAFRMRVPVSFPKGV